jgi:putative ABC transport system permease protein
VNRRMEKLRSGWKDARQRREFQESKIQNQKRVKMERLIQDIRYGIATLAKSPGFTAVAILSLALGIGANSSIFSIVYAALLKPLPYDDPNRLVMVFTETENPKTGKALSSLWSYPKYKTLRDNNESFEQVATVSSQNFPITDSQSPERVGVELVSANYFPMLGVQAVRGRTFAAEEDLTPGTHPVALIGYDLWTRRFNADPNITGQTISLNKVSLTIIGVLPAGFKGQKGTAEIWAPMMMAPQLTFPRRLQTAFASWTEVIARLKPDAPIERAQNEMAMVHDKINEAYPMPPQMAAQMPPESIKLVSLREAKLDPKLGKSFLILFVAVGFVLLIACVNIANLLLAKGISRRKEIAVRLALGATRGRLIRQLLTESVVLALIGGTVAVFVALWGIELLTDFKPTITEQNKGYIQILDFSKAGIDATVLIFNLLLSIFTGLLFGLLPALQTSKTDVNEALKQNVTSFASQSRLFKFNPRSLLVVAEIALALVLLISAGLLIKSFARLQAIPVGFESDNLMTLKVELPKYKPEAAAAFEEQLLERIKTISGVESATVATSTPLSNNSSKTVMRLKGEGEGEMKTVGVHSIAPDYFKTLRIPLLQGRAFTNQDRQGVKRVVIINQTAAERYFAGVDPIGKEVWLGVGWEEKEFGEVVGVVGDVKYDKVEQAFEPEMYVSYLQPTEDAYFVIARTTNNPTQIVPPLRKEILALDQNVPIYDVKTMDERSAGATSRTRFSALLLGLFATLALILASVGIYGVMAFAVSGRTREIGIRMALGADSRRVLGLVMRDAVILLTIGLTIGIIGALAATRVLANELYEVGTTDLATFVTVSMVLGLVALLASYLPARRATKVDPMIALRYE